MLTDTGRIAVVGATGAVGREMLTLLAERGIPPERVLPMASERSTELALPYGPEATVTVRALDVEALGAGDLALLAVSSDLARDLAPRLVARACRVIDNSSAFRMDANVPLVVPEVNGASAAGAPLVANPNCSTILLVVALEPLRRAFGIERVVVSTYQAVSGAGLGAMHELLDATRATLAGESPTPEHFPEPCAFNVFPHESPVDPATGANEEETKIVRETRRIWGDPDAHIVPTCARVPVLRSHSQSIFVELQRPASEADVRAALAAGAGLQVLDDRTGSSFPTALRASGTDAILVGRVRAAESAEPSRGRSFCLWLAGDQLRKGAALNAIQIGLQ